MLSKKSHIDFNMYKKPSNSTKNPFSPKTSKLLQQIRESVIGDRQLFHTAFGVRKICYLDYVASGRYLSFFESFLSKEIIPFYANTHTLESMTGNQTSLLREEAREIIFNCCKGCKEDVLLFCGQGTTSCVNILAQSVFNALGKDVKSKNVIVFTSIFEHHSNMLPWRELGATVILISETKTGLLNMTELIENLQKHSENKKNILIGSFSACSNVTGIMTDTTEITRLLHKYNALAFFDYAACAPYVDIEMNVLHNGTSLIQKDAIFFSTHKFIGGPGAPGILLVKKKLLKKTRPSHPGGGTVFYVTKKDHLYFSKVHEKFESGTPLITGCIKAGLVFYLKKAVGVSVIEKIESDFISRFFERFSKNRNFVVLGSKSVKRISVVSFLIKHGNQFLHAKFVTRLLNDLFGIQCRGGCMCAGPYAQELLGLTYEEAKQMEKILTRDKKKYEFLRPAFTRLNFNYFIDEETFQFVMNALEFISEHGWKLLLEYSFYPKTGTWLHNGDKKFHTRKWLHDVFFNEDGKMIYKGKSLPVAKRDNSKLFKDYMSEAHVIVKRIETMQKGKALKGLQKGLLDDEVEKFRWFMYPSESYDELYLGEKVPKKNCFVKPKMYEKIGEKKNIQITIENEDDDDEEEGENNPFSGMMNLYEDVKISKRIEDLWVRPPKSITTLVREAIEEYDMIKEGDRILVGVSGGKDSLSMLHILKEIQKQCKVNFEFGAVTIDPMASAFDPSPLKKYMKSLKVPYFYEQANIIELAKKHNTASICSFCSRLKRGLLYKICRENKYNTLILAQHLDDICESFIMSIFHNGYLRTMKANYVNDDGDVKIIRPLVFVREKTLKEFALSNRLPIIYENCPACFAQVPTERLRIKKLLKEQEHLFPHLFKSLKASISPLMQHDFTAEGKEFKKYKTKKEKEREKQISPFSGKSITLTKRHRLLKTIQTKFLEAELERRKLANMENEIKKMERELKKK